MKAQRAARTPRCRPILVERTPGRITAACPAAQLAAQATAPAAAASKAGASACTRRHPHIPAEHTSGRITAACPAAQLAAQAAAPAAAASKAGASACARRYRHQPRTAAGRRARTPRAQSRRVFPGRSRGTGRPWWPRHRTRGGPPSHRQARTRFSRQDRAAAWRARGGSGAGSQPRSARRDDITAWHAYIVRSVGAWRGQAPTDRPRCLGQPGSGGRGQPRRRAGRRGCAPVRAPAR
jgi:hypothetical protein